MPKQMRKICSRNTPLSKLGNWKRELGWGTIVVDGLLESLGSEVKCSLLFSCKF